MKSVFKTILFLIIFIVSISTTKTLNTQKNNKETFSTIQNDTKTNLKTRIKSPSSANKHPSLSAMVALGENCKNFLFMDDCKYGLKCDDNIQGIRVCMNKDSKFGEYCVYQTFGSMCRAGLTCSKKNKKCIKK